ncbi:uncharacterized protein LOC108681381 [Hyalella azteca]|uniref:Uncharacterized protein LOC108681381 n=1 Tax=Hyalella azteca TaxID=294128 RepID=A0A8B7PIA9_HYAAZ|nr:uncharacterized protein LOC108681381 [Hyalella azteca]
MSLGLPLALFLALIQAWQVPGHWLCDGMACPSNYSVYAQQRSGLDIYASGNCFTHIKRQSGAKRLACMNMCLREGCVHAITGDDGCVLLGSGVLPPYNTGLYRQLAGGQGPLVEVARGKPVNASSSYPSNPPYNWEPQYANDGVSTEKYNFFHSGLFSSGDDMYPYLLIDLLKPYAVVSVSLLPRIEKGDGVALIQRAHNITLYVGNTVVTDGVFAGVYEQFAFIAKPVLDTATNTPVWQHITPTTPLCGRYFVVKKEQGGPYHYLEITEVQVYTSEP